MVGARRGGRRGGGNNGDTRLTALDKIEELAGIFAKSSLVPAPRDTGHSIKEEGCRFELEEYELNLPKFSQAFKENDFEQFQLIGPLSPDNYTKHFHNLLWIEELAEIIAMSKFDMPDQTLIPDDFYESCGVGNIFTLEMQGVAQKQLSLMLNDKFHLLNKESNKILEACVREIDGETITYELNKQLKNSDIEGKQFDVSFSPNRITYRRMHLGADHFRLAAEDRDYIPNVRDLKKLLFPKPSDEIYNPLPKPLIDIEIDNLRCINEKMNQVQRGAVIGILKAQCRPAPYVIFGPPGTGKTATMVEAINQVYKNRSGYNMLVCASSNDAADHCAIAILQSGVVPRSKLLRLSASHRLKSAPQRLKSVTKDEQQLASSQAPINFSIIVTTCPLAGALYKLRNRYDYVFVDEAARTTEPEAMIPIGLMRRGGCCVLAGDHMQLGPFTHSDSKAGELGLNVSLMKRLCKREVYSRSDGSYDQKYITKLIMSYRSDPRVLKVNNKLFYDNELEFCTETPEKWLHLLGVKSPLVFHPVEGEDEQDGYSKYNPTEAGAVIDHVKRLYRAGLQPDQLGIISPYKRQVREIINRFERDYQVRSKQCKVATVDSFQGEEREVMIISNVRNHRFGNANYDFIFDSLRFNVAVSRAKWMVIAIGNPRVLRRDPCWEKYIHYAAQYPTLGSTQTMAQGSSLFGSRETRRLDLFLDGCTIEHLDSFMRKLGLH